MIQTENEEKTMNIEIGTTNVMKCWILAVRCHKGMKVVSAGSPYMSWATNGNMRNMEAIGCDIAASPIL